jgi:hypothetical protein
MRKKPNQMDIALPKRQMQRFCTMMVEPFRVQVSIFVYLRAPGPFPDKKFPKTLRNSTF